MKAPDVCYLQWHGDVSPEEAEQYDDDPDWKPDYDEATWCRDRIYDADVEYRRADLAAEEAERLQGEVDHARAISAALILNPDPNEILGDLKARATVLLDELRQLRAERQRARMPEELVAWARDLLAHDEDCDEAGAINWTSISEPLQLIRDILAWQESLK